MLPGFARMSHVKRCLTGQGAPRRMPGSMTRLSRGGGTMPRFAANLSMLFTEYPVLERFDRAAAAGFTAVEYLFPYGDDIAALRAALDRNGLEQILFNLPAGDFAIGERGMANN